MFGHRAGRRGHHADLRCDPAFRYHGVLPGNLEVAIFGHSLKTYGWVLLAAAAVLILCAFLVLSGSQVGRWVAIVTGAIGCISAIWRMPFYPVWVTDPLPSAFS